MLIWSLYREQSFSLSIFYCNSMLKFRWLFLVLLKIGWFWLSISNDLWNRLLFWLHTHYLPNLLDGLCYTSHLFVWIKDKLLDWNLYLLYKVDWNYRMRARATFVHEGGCNRAIVGALIYPFLYLFIRINAMFLQSLDIDSKGLMFAYFKLWFFIFGKQISDCFIVDFQHADFYLKGSASILVALYFLENTITNYGD